MWAARKPFGPSPFKLNGGGRGEGLNEKRLGEDEYGVPSAGWILVVGGVDTVLGACSGRRALSSNFQ